VALRANAGFFPFDKLRIRMTAFFVCLQQF
jgi:hypothetical protein